MINFFQKKHHNKPITNFFTINSNLLMDKQIIEPTEFAAK